MQTQIEEMDKKHQDLEAKLEKAMVLLERAHQTTAKITQSQDTTLEQLNHQLPLQKKDRETFTGKFASL